MWRPPELEEKLLSALDSALEEPRRSVERGIRSLEEAVEVTSRVDYICRQVVPGMVWDYVASKLRWARSDGTAPNVSVLAEGLSASDPVCGMSLSAERVTDRLERDGHVFYFCSGPCRREFEASPERFRPATA